MNVPDLSELSKEALSDLFRLQQEVIEAGTNKARILQVMVDGARRLAGASAAAVEMVEGEQLVYVAVSGEPVRGATGLRINIEGSLSGICMQEAAPMISADTELDDRVDRETCRRIKCRSMVLVPLTSPKGIVGVLKVFGTRPNLFTNDQVVVLPHVARLLGSSLQNAVALSNETDKLEAIFNDSPAVMAMWRGPNLIFERINSLYQNIYPGRRLIGRPLLEAIPEMAGQGFPEFLSDVFLTGVAKSGSEARLSLNGVDSDTLQTQQENRYYDYTYSRILDPDGKPYGVFCHAIDVTERVQSRKFAEAAAQETQRAEKLIAKEREELIELFRQTPIPLALLEGPEHRFSFANEAYENYFLPTREYIGTTVSELMPEAVDQGFIGLLDQVFQSGQPHRGSESKFLFYGENGYRIHQPREYFFNFLYTPVWGEAGKVRGILAAIQDVTEQVLARKRIEASELETRAERNKLESIFYGIDTPLILFRGKDLIIEMANKKYLSMMSNREILGKPFLEAIPEFSESKFPQIIQAVFDQGGAVQLAEGFAAIINPASGVREDRYFDSSFARIDSASERFVIGFTLDVTSRVNDRKNLEAAKREAENAATLKTSFLANMSHEIRTPLGVMIGFTDLIREAELSVKEKDQYLDTISRNGKALTRIIDDILDLAKVESGKLEIEKVEFSLRDLVNDVIDVFRERTRAKNISLRSNITEIEADHFIGDPTRLRQIFLNIVGNAVKFTEYGGVDLIVSIDNAGLSIQATVRIVVEDTGIGITDEQRIRLFTPFTQADNSTTRKFGGTGLGLALSRRLAMALGGDVRLLNAPRSAGTAFEITFKAEQLVESSSARSRAKPLAKNSGDTQNQLSQVRILLVDDSVDNRAFVNLMLKKQGAIVETASDGFEAVRLGSEKAFDMILMDIQMPGMDGLEATRALQAQGCETPIIALTAHAMAEERARSLAAGCSAHLTKPIHKAELIATIIKYLRTDA